jgi:hypothetical protein
MDPTFTIMAILFLVAAASGLLTWISRNVWQNVSRTRLFALLGVASTIGFVAIAMVVLP